ncbi:uncharacterized protein LOC111674313 [Orussus abietinus]|uniref:uncharacterized protein LOC111674313 n=1 Tax=Orussus abietinus TaxID=222816 RepID=UPI000C7161EB|nr:uncharacterized protein LOC111674313 [Orussus abietinus]
MVLNKLRPWAPPLTETLDPQLLDRVVDTLFPVAGVEGPRPALEPADPNTWSAELGVSEEELTGAVRRMVLVGGEDWGRTLALAEVAVQRVVAAVRDLGLEVAPHKTEALWIHNKPRREGPPPQTLVRVGGAYVQVQDSMRYLGLDLDGHWSFEGHLDRLAPRAECAAAGLCRLLPNLGGPDERVRRLYTGIVQSMLLYGSPVWAGDLMASRRSKEVLRRLQRRLAIRVVRGYRTISHEAASALAGVLPFDLQAETDATVYRCVRELRREGRGPLGLAVEAAVNLQARRLARDKWRDRLAGSAGHRAVGAVLASWDSWLDRGHGRHTYRLTQVLSVHGCFGEYLCRIGREATARCHHCDAERDTAQHTLEVCPACEAERRVLLQEIGGDLSLPAVVGAMARDERSWEAVASFCEQVMLQKEAAERDREMYRKAAASSIEEFKTAYRAVSGERLELSEELTVR